MDVFGPQQILIRGGVRETAVVDLAPFAAQLPGGVMRGIGVVLSRENWPAGGVDAEVLVSFSGAAGPFVGPGPTHIAVFVPDVKHNNVLDYPANVGFSWNPADKIATHAKARTNNPAANFQSTVTIEIN